MPARRRVAAACTHAPLLPAGERDSAITGLATVVAALDMHEEQQSEAMIGGRPIG
jgi:hypothetical protein